MIVILKKTLSALDSDNISNLRLSQSLNLDSRLEIFIEFRNMSHCLGVSHRPHLKSVLSFYRIHYDGFIVAKSRSSLDLDLDLDLFFHFRDFRFVSALFYI